MKIVVVYKWAPNPQDASVGGDGAVDWSRAKATVSEYDAVAVELGRRLADATGAELVGVSVGGKDVASPMAKKAALSRGLDEAVIVADDELASASTTRTGLVLGALLQRIGDVDLVLAGDSSIDVGAQLVPAVLAGALGWPSLAGVTAVSGTVGQLTVERTHQGGSQVLALTGPAVLAVASDAVVPRVPGMKDILAAGKRPTEQVALGDLAPRSGVEAQITEQRKPQLKARKGEVIDASDADAAAVQLVAALRAEHVI